MLFWENMKLAFTAIRVNKMRSFLTMLGIIIGISAVISIVSIGDTMRKIVADEYASIGITRAMVYVRYMEDSRMSDYYTVEDLEKIKETFGDRITYIDLGVSDKIKATRGRTTEEAYMQGVYDNYLAVTPKNKIISGRMINQKDIDGRRKNIVIEDTFAMKMFGKEDVVGETLRISYAGELDDYTIIGVYRIEQSAFSLLMSGGSNYSTVYTAAPIMVSDYGYYFNLDLYAKEGIDMDLFKKQFIGMIANMKNREETDIIYYSVSDEMGSMDSMMAGMAMAVGAIAAISLLVGGIGIMNIMLVSVTERTREIGIRKALGARTMDILTQFLIESAILSAAGGVIGTGIGVGVVTLGGMALGIAVTINPMIIIVAVTFSAVIGMFFGIYPAMKAAKADPITALRYE